MKRIIYLLLLALLVTGCSSEPKVKYVFYFIGDGMGVNEVIGTNLYNQANGQGNVNFTGFPVVNFITTVSANSLVTDSSAAGTALASGTKIDNGVVGVDPDGNWTGNLTEWAHAAGFGTGVATSVGVNHATERRLCNSQEELQRFLRDFYGARTQRARCQHRHHHRMAGRLLLPSHFRRRILPRFQDHSSQRNH